MILRTESLTKQFNNKGGCKDISLSVSEGHIFGFLGPNGAGKSTYVKTLLGLLIPQGGKAWIMDEPIGNVQIRRKIGYLPELFRYHDWLTGEELLKYHAQLYGLHKNQYAKRVEETLEIVGLKGKEKQKVGTFSKGMQQRIGLAAALINDPELLFLDEPTSALDPIGRKEVRDIICQLKDRGKTVFLNSHLLSEVESVCDEIAVINKGHIVIHGSWKDLQAGEILLEVTIKNYSEKIGELLRANSLRMEKRDETIYLSIKQEDYINKCLHLVIENGGIITKVNTKGKSLEDLFMSWINEDGKQNADNN